jgi:hypothetical protein
MSVGSPAYYYLQQFGSHVWDVFGEPPYQVGSSVESKKWRDVDVVAILSDEDWEKWDLGDLPTQPNAKCITLCMAFSELGKRMTGLPIDFKIQQFTDANKRFKGRRNALGMVGLRRIKA